MSGSIGLPRRFPGHDACRQLIVLAGALVASLLSGAGGLVAQPLDQVTRFEASVGEYLELRQRLRSTVMPEHVVEPHIREISGALLAARIRAARRGATAGEVITAMMSDWIRDALYQTFDGTDVDALLTDQYPRGFPEAGTARLNASYTDTIAVMPPAAVLAVLPSVPMPELGYRLIGRDVVLWDEEAGLAVDIVFEALSAPHIWSFLDVSSMEIRACIARALAAARLDAHSLVEDMLADTLADALPPTLGEPFPWGLGTIIPPSVLHALPALPSHLEYRFAVTDLVVIDTRTSIVVGIMHDALPRPAPGRIA
jgi:hypothetical protein